MLRFMLVALFGLWANFSVAQQIVPIDPSAIQYQPRLLALRGCGFSIGIDPSWSHKSRNRNGKVEHTLLVHNLPPGAFGSLVDEFVGPITNIVITCEQAEPSSNSGRTAYNTVMVSMRDDAVAAGKKSVSRVTKAAYGPFQNGLQYSWDSSSAVDGGIHKSISGNIFAHVGDTRVHVWYLQGSTVPSDARKLPAGTVVEASRAAHAKLTSPFNAKPSGAMFAIRTLEMERWFMATVFSTIQ
jgi:hypothetical protein